MLMDLNYAWSNPEERNKAGRAWERVTCDWAKWIAQREGLGRDFTGKDVLSAAGVIPVFSAFSHNVTESYHNPPIAMDSDEKRRESEKDSFITQFLQYVRKKRDYNKGSIYGYQFQIQLGMLSTHPSDLYPWNDTNRVYEKNNTGLHEEITDFFRYIMPTVEEKIMRKNVIDRLKKVVLAEWPDASVDVFGSFKTELHLPTSDIDVVIFGKYDNPLWKLNDIIKKSGIAIDCKVLDKATVPIVKMTDKESDVRIDISFNMENGIKSAELIKSYITLYPQLPQLVLVLKQFLLQRDLNEVWTGGISSYSLILMCVSFLRNCTKKRLDIDVNLGITLIRFLEFYGRHFDYSNTAIRTAGDISYVPKEEIMKNMDGSHWSSILCIEDPLNPCNDIGRSSYGALHVKLAFDFAFSTVSPVVLNQSSHLFEDQTSILGRIIRITPEVIKYRAFIKKKYSGHIPEIYVAPTLAKVVGEAVLNANTNNSNHKLKCNISEKGDIPNKNDIPMSSNQIKTFKKVVTTNQDSRCGQVRVSVRNDVTIQSNHNRISTQFVNKIPEPVSNKHFKKNRSTVVVNCESSRD